MPWEAKHSKVKSRWKKSLKLGTGLCSFLQVTLTGLAIIACLFDASIPFSLVLPVTHEHRLKRITYFLLYSKYMRSITSVVVPKGRGRNTSQHCSGVLQGRQSAFGSGKTEQVREYKGWWLLDLDQWEFFSLWRILIY